MQPGHPISDFFTNPREQPRYHCQQPWQTLSPHLCPWVSVPVSCHPASGLSSRPEESSSRVPLLLKFSGGTHTSTLPLSLFLSLSLTQPYLCRPCFQTQACIHTCTHRHTHTHPCTKLQTSTLADIWSTQACTCMHTHTQIHTLPWIRTDPQAPSGAPSTGRWVQAPAGLSGQAEQAGQVLATALRGYSKVRSLQLIIPECIPGPR